MIDIFAKPGSVIQLGHSGENDAVRVCFSLKAFQHVFPGRVPSLLVKRNGDKTSYPVPLEVDDAFAFWLVSNADTEKHGLGECELHWVINDILVKTDKFKFLVKEALDGGSEPPDPAGKAWYEKIESEIGDLSKLETEEKDSLVGAINEAAKSGLPEITEDTKEMALYNDGEKAEWKPVNDRLPSVTTNDDGNVLVVRQISEFEAAYVLEHMPNINDFINLGITDASPGQFAKVLAVDEIGQPISWEAVDMPSGGGSPSSALICDVTLAEAVQAVSQTLEHNFYALHCIVHCGTSGVTLLVDADGTAQKGYINMLLDTVAQSDLSKLCGATYFGGMAWKTHLMHAIWSPDRTYFEQAMNATLENRTNAAVNQSFGGIANMKGTIGPSAVSPDSGRTVNIVAPVNTLLNAGVRVIIWGEYYE